MVHWKEAPRNASSQQDNINKKIINIIIMIAIQQNEENEGNGEGEREHYLHYHTPHTRASFDFVVS